MIIFRYHVVSLIAVLLALAAGIALGAGLDFDNDASKAATPGQSPSEETSNSARSGLDEALVESVEPALVRNRLRDRAVALVVLPDATTEAEKAITASIERAGGRLTSVLRAGPDLVDPAKKQLVDALGGQLEADAKDVVIPESASAYDRIGALLGYAIGTTEAGGDAPSSRAQSILAGLSTAGLISFSQDVERRAGLVLVLAGPPSGDSAADQGIASIVDSLAGALDEQTGESWWPVRSTLPIPAVCWPRSAPTPIPAQVSLLSTASTGQQAPWSPYERSPSKQPARPGSTASERVPLRYCPTEAPPTRSRQTHWKQPGRGLPQCADLLLA
ncbi:MAG: copper transporter [Nocardioidaceae bacterium]|nr:MAG: copper transporter [Nocardioidaceae bacterium]